jgi:hypothetical protein
MSRFLATAFALLATVGGRDRRALANCIAGCDYLYTTGTADGLTVYDIRNLDAPS